MGGAALHRRAGAGRRPRRGQPARCRLVASTGLWVGWAVGVVAAFVPHPLAPDRPAGGGARPRWSPRWWPPPPAHPSALAVAWAAGGRAPGPSRPAIGATCVNGPAYPNERRFLLRAPGRAAGRARCRWRGSLSVAGVGRRAAAAGRPPVGARRAGCSLVGLAPRLPAAASRCTTCPAGGRCSCPPAWCCTTPSSWSTPCCSAGQDVDRLRPATAADDRPSTSPSGPPASALELALDEPTTVTLLEARPAGGRADPRHRPPLHPHPPRRRPRRGPPPPHRR